MNRKAKFFQIYANLPLSLRKEIIVVINDEPITWNVANIEIETNTKIGEKILNKLIDMEIIKTNE